MLQISDPRLLDILNPRIKRVATVYSHGQPPSQVKYWSARPPDERIAAVIATVSVMTDIRLTLDMLEFVGYLNQYDVRYLIVGGYALGFHGYPRFTKDLDIWIERSADNGQRLAAAMTAFGITLSAAEIAAFVNGGPIRIGRPPNLIDIIGAPDGITFADCYERRDATSFEGLQFSVLGREDFIRNKLASGRLQDLADVASLETPPAEDL